MLIDCDQCVMQHSDACNDCIVTALLDHPPGAVVFDVVQERALRNLHNVGLAPASHYLPLGETPAGSGG